MINQSSRYHTAVFFFFQPPIVVSCEYLCYMYLLYVMLPVLTSCLGRDNRKAAIIYYVYSYMLSRQTASRCTPSSAVHCCCHIRHAQIMDKTIRDHAAFCQSVQQYPVTYPHYVSYNICTAAALVFSRFSSREMKRDGLTGELEYFTYICTVKQEHPKIHFMQKKLSLALNALPVVPLLLCTCCCTTYHTYHTC